MKHSFFKKSTTNIIILVLVSALSSPAHAGGDEPVGPVRIVLDDALLKAVLDYFNNEVDSDVVREWNALDSVALGEAIRNIVDEGVVPVRFLGRLTLGQAQTLAWKRLWVHSNHKDLNKRMGYLIGLTKLVLLHSYKPSQKVNGFDSVQEWLADALAKLLEEPIVDNRQRQLAGSLWIRLRAQNNIRHISEEQRNQFWGNGHTLEHLSHLISHGTLANPISSLKDDEAFALFWERSLRRSFYNVPISERAGEILALAGMFKRPEKIGNEQLRKVIAKELKAALQQVINSDKGS